MIVHLIDTEGGNKSQLTKMIWNISTSEKYDTAVDNE